MTTPPPAAAFPAWPASWYLFGESRELRPGPVSRQLLGRRLVAFRNAAGRVAVMDGHCAHLGADLGCGDVVGDTLRCPFHHWRYGSDGVCAAAGMRLQTYPVAERHGSVFFFNGRQPLFPLPFLLGEDAAAYAAAPVFRYVADCTWYMNSAHAFDRQHFAAVHDRELLAPPVVDCPAPYARRNSYLARVVGTSLADRILKVTAGRRVETTLTIWGGTFAVITARFDRVNSGFLMAMEPLEDGRTLCHGIVCAPRSRLPLLTALQLRVRRRMTFSYLRDEARRLRGTCYRPGSLGPDDQDMIDFFHWVAALPQEPPREGDHEDSARTPQPGPVALSVRAAAGAGAAARS